MRQPPRETAGNNSGAAQRIRLIQEVTRDEGSVPGVQRGIQ